MKYLRRHVYFEKSVGVTFSTQRLKGENKIYLIETMCQPLIATIFYEKIIYWHTL